MHERMRCCAHLTLLDRPDPSVTVVHMPTPLSELLAKVPALGSSAAYRVEGSTITGVGDRYTIAIELDESSTTFRVRRRRRGPAFEAGGIYRAMRGTGLFRGLAPDPAETALIEFVESEGWTRSWI